jgi:NADH-quinone oxidoreductase subunit L
METWLWLIPVLPLFGAALNGLALRRAGPRAVGAVGCGSVGLAFLLAAAAMAGLLRVPAGDRLVQARYFTWIATGDLSASFGLRFDPLSAVMALVVTGVGFLIHVYSVGYMRGDRGYARYFAYLNLFMFAMLLLVLADNFLLLFVGWEGVGLCSYLLIGFWFDRPAAVEAGKKAFLVNRVGDFAFLLGLFLLFREMGTFSFDVVAEHGAVVLGTGTATIIALLFFAGATGKSAQIPLYVWLPDAMEGPTPVSALIHAATMVTAGVYLVARASALFVLAPAALAVVASIGAVTALFAATIAMVQTDIKRVLAYSTISQIGLMFVGAGVGAFASGIFHLVTHAFFKALLFLGAGSVIHALSGEQDLRRMGGLARRLPRTHAAFLTGALAIAGVAPLAGFFSKDAVLGAAYGSGHRTLWFLGIVTATLTAFYIFRLYILCFRGGEERMDARAKAHLHESPAVMTLPLVVLAVLSATGGFLNIPLVPGAQWLSGFLAPVFGGGGAGLEEAAARASHAGHAMPVWLESFLMLVSLLAAGAGIGIAFRMYVFYPSWPGLMTARFGALHRLLSNKYYVDEAYTILVIWPVKVVSHLFWKIVDVVVVDGSLVGLGRVVAAGGAVLRRLQSGSVQAYAVLMILGAVVLLYVLLR